MTFLIIEFVIVLKKLNKVIKNFEIDLEKFN